MEEEQDLRAGRVREGMAEEEVAGFDETYRKMSMEHTRKLAKDTLEAINKLGKQLNICIVTHQHVPVLIDDEAGIGFMVLKHYLECLQGLFHTSVI